MMNNNTFLRTLAFVLCCLSCSMMLNAQVANDDCNSAEDLGTLAFGVPTCVDGSNVGANAELPYISQGYCGDGVPMPEQAADVWYTFTVTGNKIDIDGTFGTENIVMSLYEGTCADPIGRDCIISDTGVGSTTFAPVVAGQVYYLQVSGGNLQDQGDFNICLTSYGDAVTDDICILSQTLTLNPPPSLGAYTPGEFIQVCLEIGGYNQNASDWFHGLVPVFGNGWDVSTIEFEIPTSCDGSGEWGWYETVEGTTAVGAAIGPQGPGWFYDSIAGGPLDGDAGNNYGDNSGGASCNWTFCMTVGTIASCPPAENGDDLSIEFLNFSDSETGSWDASSICPEDPNFKFKALLACCAAPELEGENPTCASPNGGSILAVSNGTGPFTFEWSNDFVEEGFSSTAEGLSEGFYVVTVTDISGCTSAASFTLTEESTGINLSIPVSVDACGACEASNIQIVSATDGSVVGNYPVSECPEDIVVCLPDNDSFNLVLADLVIENAVVDGELSSDEVFTFNLGTPSDAGTMPQDALVICSGNATDIATSDATVQDGQILVYALHTSITDAPGDVIAVNAENGSFSLADGATAYETYYISALAGPDENGDGVPDLDSGCTSIAFGPSVVFLAPLTFDIDEDCDWSTGTFIVTVQLSGGYPEYDNSLPYGVIGDYAGDIFFGEEFVAMFEEGVTTSYSFTATESCATETASSDFYCEKTPIELLSFEGETKEAGNYLTWKVATEENNDYYTLEYSTDGTNFKSIAQIDGAGNSFVTQSYSYLDTEAKAGLAYYRLSQTDFDGSTQYVGTVVLNRTTTTLGFTSIQPIPSSDIVTVAFETPTTQKVTLTLHDISGRIVLEKTVDATQGITATQIDISDFAAGIYTLSMSDSNSLVVEKIVKK